MDDAKAELCDQCLGIGKKIREVLDPAEVGFLLAQCIGSIRLLRQAKEKLGEKKVGEMMECPKTIITKCLLACPEEWRQNTIKILREEGGVNVILLCGHNE